MAFDLGRSLSTAMAPKSVAHEKRNPISILLNRKKQGTLIEDLPEIDIAAGLGRVLRSKQLRDEQKLNEDNAESLIRACLLAIESTLYSIDQIREIIEQSFDVVLSAQNVEEIGGRALLAESYDELRLSINSTIENLDEHSRLLIGKDQRHIDVPLDGKAHYSISPTRLDISSRGLGLNPPRDAFATFEEITEVMAELDKATDRTDRAAAEYCRDAQYLMAKIDALTERSPSDGKQ